MDITLTHALEYGTESPVSVEDLIKSLEANERLIRQSGRLLAELIPGLEVETTRVSVTHISQESPLKEYFAAALVLAFQPKMSTAVPHIIEGLTGTPLNDDYNTVLTLFVLLIAVEGIGRAYERFFPGKDKREITETRDSLLKKAAAITGVAAARIVDAIAVLFTGKTLRPTVAASQKVFAPTRGQQNACIRDSRRAVLIPPGAVALAQAAAGLPYEVEADDSGLHMKNEWHPKASVVFHAHDRDKQKTGWAGHIPKLFDDRIPMILDKSQKPEKLFGKTMVTADVLVTMVEDENGDMRPKEMLLVHAYGK